MAEDIKTKTPEDLLPVLIRKQALTRALGDLDMGYLRGAYRALFDKPGMAKTKEALVDETAEALTFLSEAEFRAWFFTRQAVIRHILYRSAFVKFMPVALLEKELNQSIVTHNSSTPWRSEWHVDQEYTLDFLPLHIHYGQPFTSMPEFLQSVLSTWLVPPLLMDLSACKLPDHERSSKAVIWNNSMTIADSFPLLCDKLAEMFEQGKDAEQKKNIQEGFRKKERIELQESSGFLPFDIGPAYGPDSVDLAARFILCMYNFKPRRHDDSQEGIRSLVQAFFSEQSLYPQKWHAPDRNYLEFNFCLAYLNRTMGYYLDNNKQLPPSRKVFQELLLELAQDQETFDTDKLAEHIYIKGKDFSFCDQTLEKTLKLKAEFLEIDGISYVSQQHDEFHPDGIMRYYLLVRPLFKAYCYLFAVLGILEITQETPSCCRYYRCKQYPISPYESLKTIRITKFGRWCLGLTEQCPPRPSGAYQAIADKDLFLVTVQGNSLEIRVYLDQIGLRLGEYRWRISPASFIAGCSNKKQIEERIERFKRLIDPAPQPHWEDLFKKSLDRAGLFTISRSDMVVYDLPEDQELVRELLRNPELKTIVKRAEGRLLVVPSKDQRRFFALLHEHGIAHF
jgi:hypothetical protein